MHKYRADGALGSSWHSYVHSDSTVFPPIQEDETAIVVYLFCYFYQKHPDLKLLTKFYDSMVVPMANFMTDYIDIDTGLPKPSYDLWEQTFLTSTYTTALVHASLLAASDLAAAADDSSNAVKWRTAANSIQEASHKLLFNKNKSVLLRGINVQDGKVVNDEVVDCSSVFGAYMYGLFNAGSDEMKSSVKTLEDMFGISGGSAVGLPRYEDDEYRRSSPGITGNLWFVTSLWLAQYYIDQGEITKAMPILEWTKAHAGESGIMGEQLDPVTDRYIPPSPLTWTHAEYLTTLLNLVSELGG
ncbi:hypothetical protein HGB25_03595 [Candidatus Saccharibacteria bacterium]|nr:hypothetical protein [Candidatus Saccharibacteria bacterium]